MHLAFALALTSALAGNPVTIEGLGIVRAATGKKQSLALSVFATASVEHAAPAFESGAAAGVSKLYALDGNRPVRQVFALRRADGSAIGVVRENLEKKSRLELTVVATPKSFSGKPKVLASSKGASLGFMTGDGRVEALGAMDRDGDGVDELVLVRAWSDGHRSLEFRAPPAKKAKPLGPLVDAIDAFDPGYEGDIRRVFGFEGFGFGAAQIVVVLHGGAGTRIVMLTPPDAGAVPFAAYAPIPAGSDVLDVGPFDHPGSFGNELVLLEQTSAGRFARLLPPPSGLDVPLPPPLTTLDLSSGPVGAFPATFAFAAPVSVPPSSSGPGSAAGGPAIGTANGNYALSFGWVGITSCVGCYDAPTGNTMAFTGFHVSPAGSVILVTGPGVNAVLPTPSIQPAGNAFAGYFTGVPPIPFGFVQPPSGPTSGFVLAGQFTPLSIHYDPISTKWWMSCTATGQISGSSGPPYANLYSAVLAQL